MPYKLAISLSVLWASCLMTAMADETRWQQYNEAGVEAHQRGDYAVAVNQFQLALKEAEDFGEEDPRFANTTLMCHCDDGEPNCHLRVLGKDFKKTKNLRIKYEMIQLYVGCRR